MNDVLKNMKGLIAKEFAGVTYVIPDNTPAIKFRLPDAGDIKMKLRKPNEIEIRKEFVNRLRYCHFTMLDLTISHPQVYRSLKGEVRRGNFEGVFNYLKKHGIDYEAELHKYANSEIILEAKHKVTFDQPIKVATIDISVAQSKNE